MNALGLIIAAFLVGLVGSTHCLGMCGGISTALSFALPEEQRKLTRTVLFQVLYSLGRISTYIVCGMLIAAFGAGLFKLIGHHAQLYLRIFSAAFIIVLGLYLTRWWTVLARIEVVGAKLWQHLSPLTRKFIPVTHTWQALLIGALWGWLPCGLVYSNLLWAASSGSYLNGAFIMLGFGLGTLPAMVAVGSLASRKVSFLRRRSTQICSGLIVVAFGCWMLLMPIQHLLSMSHMH